MKIELTKEIIFQTARSGGKGGQNVNKVETMVEGYFHVRNSALLSEDQKTLLERKLAGKIGADGYLQVRSQVYRSQLSNKEEVVRKMQLLVEAALKREKRRVATKPTKGSKEKRIGQKKKLGEIKQGRKRIRGAE
ncbi:MAG TPA: alternative ribosome rescue aminoacyl-tRNA hydrolase ArfB [Puia sp.]|nr:alternative ribosome rescue aminoacyl-tRNA hydrolase ArfB [Puia sp.]